jgi:hypothetical protein
MYIINIARVEDVEAVLAFEFGVDTQDTYTQTEIREVISEIVKRAENGEREIDSPYLGARIVIP